MELGSGRGASSGGSQGRLQSPAGHRQAGASPEGAAQLRLGPEPSATGLGLSGHRTGSGLTRQGPSRAPVPPAPWPLLSFATPLLGCSGTPLPQGFSLSIGQQGSHGCHPLPGALHPHLQGAGPSPSLPDHSVPLGVAPPEHVLLHVLPRPPCGPRGTGIFSP